MHYTVDDEDAHYTAFDKTLFQPTLQILLRARWEVSKPTVAVSRIFDHMPTSGPVPGSMGTIGIVLPFWSNGTQNP